MPATIGRRELIAAFGCAAAAWPLAARAQQSERMRRIGVLMGGAAGMTDQQAGLAVFMQLLHQLGWTEDRNVQLETRWVGGDPARARRYAEELVALPAEVIMTNGAFMMEALLRATARCQSYSAASPIRLAAALSKAWRDQVATQPGSVNLNTH